ncbi:MAG: hypothetical protein EA425_05000 [Puniceicoccaceae bacterium]|nr:MAG: hypothetical protein EA425_05000 [Puniceicoccaceae bacterium]
MPNPVRCLLPAAAGVLVLLLAGCATTPPPIQPAFNLVVDPAYAGASIQVDLVGVNASEVARWRTKSVNDYFSPGDPFRATAERKSFLMGPDGEDAPVLAANDPIWQRWQRRDVSFIVVLADLPGYMEDREGAIDSRRLIVPLGGDRWDRARPSTITLEISPTGVSSIPAPVRGDS